MLNNTSYYDTSPKTFDELINLAVNRMNESFDDDNHIVYLVWKGQFQQKVSCSHYAPKGECTNWGNQYVTRPTHFPGWEGRVWVSYKHKTKNFGFNILRNTGISSGTGGYGLYSLPDWVGIAESHLKYSQKQQHYNHYPLSYHSRIFDMDFPLLSEDFTKDAMRQQVAAELKGKWFKYTYPIKQAVYVHPDYVK